MRSASLKKGLKEYDLPKRAKVAVLVSGGGSNLEALLQAERSGAIPDAEIIFVLSSKAGVQALERARRYQVPSQVIERGAYPNDLAFQTAVLQALKSSGAEIICLAGYLKKIGPALIETYRGR